MSEAVGMWREGGKQCRGEEMSRAVRRWGEEGWWREVRQALVEMGEGAEKRAGKDWSRLRGEAHAAMSLALDRTSHEAS